MRHFSNAGALLGEWALDAGATPKGFAVDAIGRVYLAGTAGGIMRYVP